MGDVGPYYLNWIKEMEDLGVIKAYKQEGGFDQYPPLVVLNSFIIKQAFNISYITSWKISGAFSILFSSYFVYLTTKSKLLGSVPILALGIPTLWLGYADIHFVPALLLSLFLLSRERFFPAGILFAISCLFKWQPIIFFPAVVLFMIAKRRHRDALEFSFGAGLIALLTVFAYGWYNPAKSIWLSSLNHYFSAWGPNLYWIVTWILSTRFPTHLANLGIWGGGPGSGGTYGSLKGNPKQGLFLIAKSVFATLYLTQVTLYARKVTFSTLNAIRLGAAVSLIYWQFSPGVHANHIFFLLPTSIILCWKERKYIKYFGGVFFIVNLNLIRVLGIDGTGKGRIMEHILGLDTSLLFSAISFGLAVHIILLLFRDARRNDPDGIKT